MGVGAVRAASPPCPGFMAKAKPPQRHNSCWGGFTQVRARSPRTSLPTHPIHTAQETRSVHASSAPKHMVPGVLCNDSQRAVKSKSLKSHSTNQTEAQPEKQHLGNQPTARWDPMRARAGNHESKTKQSIGVGVGGRQVCPCASQDVGNGLHCNNETEMGWGVDYSNPSPLSPPPPPSSPAPTATKPAPHTHLR